MTYIDALDLLENEEMKMLSWGITDQGFNKGDLEQLWGNEHFDQLFNDLIQRNLIYMYTKKSGGLYRSRMAETIRLLASLRQLFPQHREADSWKKARKLVGDYRLLKQPREYPRRDQKIVPRDFGENNSPAVMVLQVIHGNLNFSAFQIRSLKRIFNNSQSGSGTIICAGTGSGKTLAYYLPALMKIAESVRGDKTKWVRAVSIYPRTELLKDQLSEVLRLTRLINRLPEFNQRKIRVAALYGETPEGVANIKEQASWLFHDQGYICPYVICPVENCGSQMVWSHDDIALKSERLTCINCNETIDSSEVILTRKSILSDTPATPGTPDILFTTTEMMNQRMSDPSYWKVFSINEEKKPFLFLLDEVHTYNNVHGAQVAYLLRRWKSLSKADPHFVGLSATLRDARGFFVKLTGVSLKNTVEVSPFADEMEKEGSEYILVLRNDPDSRASLLSTTIQSAMLLRRMMDPSALKEGYFGNRLFLFTDDLDVTNRLYNIMCEVEGRSGKNVYSPRYSILAKLRNPDKNGWKGTSDQFKERHYAGQLWHLATLIGFNLSDGIRSSVSVGLTSSQSKGVDPDAEIIVTTAALDVGYNDPELGAVLQHKSPRNMAQFLQRKGRAGRRRKMRPWTVVVLSDYGRDRNLYHSYEQLFDPELAPNTLPVHNIYVKKMQAVYVLLEWLARQINQRNNDNSSVWKALTGEWQLTEDSKSRLLEQIGSLFRKEEQFEAFCSYLRVALSLEESDLHTVLWEEPRGLMTSVIPIAYWRLKTNWSRKGNVGLDFKKTNNPLPEFIPGSLFSPLNLPEISFRIPLNNGPSNEQMPVLQGLKEFAPGRVSKRFAIEHSSQKHWVDPRLCCDISKFIAWTYPVNEVTYKKDNQEYTLKCYRPVNYIITDAPEKISDRSNAFQMWLTRIQGRGNRLLGRIPGRWSGILRSINYCSHRGNNPAIVDRFSLGTVTNILLEKRDDTLENDLVGIDREFRYRYKDEDVALGYSQDVDALWFELTIPGKLYESDNPRLWESMRYDFFVSLVKDDAELKELGVNVFQREWLAQVFASSLMYESLSNNSELRTVVNLLEVGQVELQYQQILSVLEVGFFSDNADTVENNENQTNTANLLELLNCQEIISRLLTHVSVLYAPPDERWEQWLRRIFKKTFGAAAMAALIKICGDIDERELILDIDQPDLEGNAVVWVSETVLGGVGILQKFSDLYHENPGRFFDCLDECIGESEFDQAYHDFEKITGMLSEGVSPLRDECIAYVNETNMNDKAFRLEVIRQKLAALNIPVSHIFQRLIGSRLLRPGASVELYTTVNNFFSRWTELESRLGLEIDLRIVAQLLSLENQQYDYYQILSMLIPRGRKIRNADLEIYNPFVELPPSEKLLLSGTLENEPVVIVNRDEIESILEEDSPILIAIRNYGGVVCSFSDDEFAKTALVRLLLQQVSYHGLMVYLRIVGMAKSEGRVLVTVKLSSGL